MFSSCRGDREAQLEIQRPEVRTPSVALAQEQICEIFFQSQNIVLTHCRCAQPLCKIMRTHKNDDLRTLILYAVVHVRVWWITETRKHCRQEEKLGSAVL